MSRVEELCNKISSRDDYNGIEINVYEEVASGSAAAKAILVQFTCKEELDAWLHRHGSLEQFAAKALSVEDKCCTELRIEVFCKAFNAYKTDYI